MICTVPYNFRGIKLCKMRLAGRIAHMGKKRIQSGLWWGKQSWRDHWEKPRHRWEDIKIDLKEMVREVLYWIDLPLGGDRLLAVVNTAMNTQVPWSAGDLSRWGSFSFRRGILLRGLCKLCGTTMLQVPVVICVVSPCKLVTTLGETFCLWL